MRTTLALLLAALCLVPTVRAAEPVVLRETLGGQLDFLVFGRTMRSLPDSATDTNGNGVTDSCEVVGSTNITVSGIPGTATIRRAYLYWAASRGSRDATANFDGAAITADRGYTERFTFGGNNLDYYMNFEDVTTQVAAGRNKNYSISGIATSTGSPWCDFSAVLKGVTLIVVYEDAGEPQRVLNLFDGFQFFRGSSLTLIPDNFKVPPTAKDGKVAYLTWEGDPGNSAPLGGFQERVSINGNTVEDPPNNADGAQFNGTITDNVTGQAQLAEYGVDLDVFDISNDIDFGDTQATTVYSSGADLVLLSAEVFMVRTNTADLTIDKSHIGDLFVGLRSDWEINVANAGPVAATNIEVTDTLPAGVTYDNFRGTGWTCGAVGQDVTCTHPGPIAGGASFPTLTLEVLTDATVAGTVNNTADVTSDDLLELDPTDNTDTDARNSSNFGPQVMSMKAAVVVSDPTGGANPKAIPGAVVQYDVSFSNSGNGPVDNDGMVVVDTLPPETSLFVGDLGGTPSGPVQFVDGAGADNSGLNAAGLVVEYSTDGVDFSYTPVPDGDGFDSAISHVRMVPDGTFRASGGADTPQFRLRYRVRVD